MWIRPLLLALALPLMGQIVLNPPREAPSFSVDVELVNVVCTVRDGRGAFVRDLSRDDFELKDNGKVQDIRSFARETDSSLTIALLIDVSGSVASIIDVEKASGARFFRSILRKGDRAMVTSFAGMVTNWQEFTGSVDALLAGLERVSPLPSSPEFRSRGGTLLYDAVNLVATQRLRQQPGRKAMIVITDGVDSGSLVDHGKASPAAQEADTVMYAIHYEDEGGRFNGGRSGLGPLKKMAEPTGGRVFEMRKKLELQSIFDSIEEEMRSQYSLSFKAPAASADGKFRKLEVRVRRSGLNVHAREGYYLAGRGLR